MKRTRLRKFTKPSRTGASQKRLHISEVSITEIITALSLIVALFSGAVIYASYIHMNTFFNTSGINLDFMPISISNSLDIFKKYIPLSYFYTGLLCLFLAYTVIFLSGNKKTPTEVMFEFSSKGYASTISTLVFLAIVVFYAIIALLFGVPLLDIMLNIFVLVILFFSYLLAGKKFGKYIFLNIFAICIFLFSTGFYCGAIAQAAKQNAKFLLSENNLSKVVLNNGKTERKLFLVTNSGAFYVNENNIEFTYISNVFKYIYSTK